MIICSSILRHLTDSDLGFRVKGTYVTGEIATLDVSNSDDGKRTRGRGRRRLRPALHPGSGDLVLATQNRQIGRYVAATGDILPLTNDTGGGAKTDPFAFRAPEAGNAVLIVAFEKQQDAVVHEPPAEEGGFWAQRVTLPEPATSTETFAYSVTPFTVGGRSYFTLHPQLDEVTPPGATTSSIWPYAMDAVDDVRLARRLDDGTSAHRIDPEWFIVQNEVFVYCNLLPCAGGF